MFKKKKIKTEQMFGGGGTLSTSKNKIKKLLPIIILSLFLIIGITYASFNVDIKGLINLNTSLPSISLTYTEPANALRQTNEILSEEEHKTSSDYFEFNVSSTSAIEYDLFYRIYIKEDTSNTLSRDNLYVYLTEVNNNAETEVLGVTKLTDLKENTNYDNSYNLYNNSFNFTTNTKTTKEKTYRFRIWQVPQTTSNSITIGGGTYSYTINVESYECFLYNVIKNQVKTTNISYKYINDANVTINGVTYNSDDNGVFLFNDTDDNGGSNPIYYYRGNVTNNNVLFADLCWKIVRTTSTGGVKLIYNGELTNGTCDNTGDDSQYGTSVFNSNNNSPADVGYMYGTRYTISSKELTNITDSYVYGRTVTYSGGKYTLNTTTTSTGSNWSTDRTTLANGYHYTCFSTLSSCSTVYYITYFGNSSIAYYLTFTGGVNLATAKSQMYTNTTNSIIKTNVDSFYKEKLLNYTTSLENTIFCNDRSLADGISGGSLAGESVNSTSISSFAASTRSSSPSLKCINLSDQFSLSTSSGGTDGYGNNKLIYPIGLLTSDEVTLGGGKLYTANNNFYLRSQQYYWLGTPFYISENINAITSLTHTGYLEGWKVSHSSQLYGVRPVISLKSETIASSGNGTLTNPYVIN